MMMMMMMMREVAMIELIVANGEMREAKDTVIEPKIYYMIL